ncbi:MAG TPA: GspE/PulE family protein [Thermoanaerobaculia bacterium]|jgi:general secretion pathway protein E|nr:type II/IV secretion system protein [Thermoanaerobaculia bacterium]MBP7813610.1 type II/IV secretion system protein [Thermoanaerobaculia bacterium]MBP8844447.1 type II/IV secretion system protein [Thermoanaerobaculia bacterium]HPA95992.1 GspE/PulE family protein [Thermoanaerobaculia bacterium]HQP93449.1 GspE/PulE family protein [Thermoanaerobaculia bacterium]
MTLDPNTVADLLARQGLVSPENAELIRKEARQLPAHRRSARAYEQQAVAYELIQTLHLPNARDGGVIGEYEIARAIAADAGLEFVRIDSLSLDADLIESKISRPFAKRHRMLPLQMVEGRLRVACANPYDIEAIDSFRRIAGREPELVVASEPDILRALTEFYGLRHAVKRAERDLSAGIDLGNLEQLVRMKSESEIESSDQHIVNAVEFMLQHAYDTRASDIHLEPKRDVSLARFRIDGVLHDIQTMPKIVHAAVVSRIKTMSRLDIAEKRRPQDGRVKTTRGGREIELRVSTLPVAFGEKVVMRIFDPEVLMQDLSGLGFYPEELILFQEFISRPHGIILVTGPTGSGKTTTLYSALKAIANREINVTTIEDPIEMVIEDFNQTSVQSKVGIDFARALRHILRQDPDVIMVGEIRDGDTAQYAIQAALTGHLVFSTLHTNDAASSISRLVDLGVERFLISSTLIGTMAQRLVRRICPHCTGERYLSNEEAATLRLTVPAGKRIKVQEGRGCFECRGTGYLGRTGIFEILAVDDAIKALILEGADAPAIKREAAKNGMRTLRQSALRKLAEGLTTFEEVVRVTGL